LSSEFVNVTDSAHKVLRQGNFVLMMSEGLFARITPSSSRNQRGLLLAEALNKRILKEPNDGTLEFYRTRHTVETHSPFP